MTKLDNRMYDIKHFTKLNEQLKIIKDAAYVHNMNKNLFCIYQNVIYKINKIHKLKIYEDIKRNFDNVNTQHRYHNVKIDIIFNINSLDDTNTINLILENVQLSSNVIIFVNNVDVAKSILNHNLLTLNRERISNYEKQKEKLLLLKASLKLKICNYRTKIDMYENQINEIQQKIEKVKCDV